MINTIGSSLIKVLREFGPVGLVTYAGGLILVAGFFFEQNFQRQITLGVVGVILLLFSIFIAHFRLKIQKDREKALVTMAESTCNRLAEQLGKSLTDKQVFGIIQKIRQTQRDLISAIAGNVDSENEKQ